MNGKTPLVASAIGCLIVAHSAFGHDAHLKAESFKPYKPKVRHYWDSTYFYVESDGMPDPAKMPNLMVGITSWQQQIPLPTSYFFATTNPENNSGSLGYGQPNVWRLPLVPTPAASPISLNGNFLRGAVAVAANGIAIFNPRNNRGEYSYAIGELDQYGGHCGLADDYHYHIAPVHLQAELGVDKPVAWALDGYPIYGFTEPDGSPQLPLDADGGHQHGAWGYHYHARGSTATGHVAPYLMDAMHGTVVSFGGQVDPQPEVQSMRASGTGGYNAQAVAGAVVTAYLNPVAFSVDGSGHLVHNPAGTPSPDQYLMRYAVGATTYDICWRINRSVNPKTLTITFRHPTTGTTTTTYNNGTNNRLKAYPMAAWSMLKLPDTTAQDGTATFGEDADYAINPQSFTDNGNGTITDNVTGLMWQKTDNGESTWDTAVTNAASVTTGGYNDWRLPTPAEAFSILNHANNPALNLTYFPSHPSGAAAYWWTSDIFGTDATRVWCTNSGGGLGAHPKAETLSAGGTLRFHARYVRGPKPSNGHNYLNNEDGTITDLDTGLMWTQVPSGALNWNAALSYAEGLTTAGFGDWRLPNVKELQSLVDITLATATSAAGAQPCIQRKLFPTATATACWSSTPLRSGGGSPAQAWLVEFGVNTAATPSRNSQGIVSYEPFASTYPVFAVRSASTAARSISQGRATTTTANLYPPGQRVSAVGTITATDGTVWTVPSATQFTTAAKAPDLYNESASPPVIPANITAAAAAIASAPTVVVDPDGEVITGYIFADNYFELYVNGTLVGVDPVPYTPFNSCVVKFKAKRPITYAFRLVDWEENLGLGTELNGGNSYYPGDGGLMASFSDGTVTNGQWKAQSFNIAPLDDPAQVVELADGTHDSSAAIAHTLTETAYALHYPVPSGAFSPTFNDAGWPNATTYTEAAVGVGNKPAYTNFPGQFGASAARFIWSSNLVLDNEVIVRYTTPVAPPSIGEIRTSPNTPTFADDVFVTAQLQATSGASITGATLTYRDGTQSTGTVFTETMATLASSPWTGTNAVNPWTVTSTGTPNTVRQTTAANHGSGNPCGLTFDKGTVSLADSMAATTNAINATGTAGFIEFWVATSNMISPNGWTFQTSIDNGATWTTRLAELTGSNHAFQLYHYDLLSTERVNTLKIRFQFAGYNAVSPTPAPKAYIDDIKLVTTTGNPPVTLAMLDDGLHGDGLAGDGIYGALIPVRPAGTVVSYGITATDSNGTVTTASAAGTYTVNATGPPANFSATATVTAGNAVIQWPSQSGISYSVQWSEDLIHWHDVPVGQTNTWTDTAAVSTHPRRFYRVAR